MKIYKSQNKLSLIYYRRTFSLCQRLRALFSYSRKRSLVQQIYIRCFTNGIQSIHKRILLKSNRKWQNISKWLKSRYRIQIQVQKSLFFLQVKKQNRHNDLFEHYTLRIEPPVLNKLPKIIYEDENYLVVSKPPYMCVHASGGHLHNTLIDILKYQMNYKNQLFTLHRLDKLTSGILILGKNKEISIKFQEEKIKKKYYARVEGNFFPEKQDQEEIICERNIACQSRKEGKYLCSDNKEGKYSKTIFKKIWYDSKTNTSLIQCNPITGRTHQIRVHCSFLGYPIVNDINYGGKFIGNAILQQLENNEEECEKKEIQFKQQELYLMNMNGIRKKNVWRFIYIQFAIKQEVLFLKINYLIGLLKIINGIDYFIFFFQESQLNLQGIIIIRKRNKMCKKTYFFSQRNIR
ncbi:hypothetical protein IMG5_129080 [Ichthyophthirius multifiliis]|uniref:Pseudouridine synthase RsuA/RluA-like domain-containing protein n=1 Tax=Ichthyophthirius multifiliis TaxID=5932 RepID=G0QW37_ICHMU|nr:hypothetical protein IMG5_129080 [Ichthyophthirius multifiliis]EGR30574.1 hypothetical protein IMG5_129080 [Ichthyophthirius multifiliis]|eukprot:XP_004032161.1 hypothetical protein IMG5_129080 [Ichthyophthirius multifiliis]